MVLPSSPGAALQLPQAVVLSPFWSGAQPLPCRTVALSPCLSAGAASLSPVAPSPCLSESPKASPSLLPWRPPSLCSSGLLCVSAPAMVLPASYIR
jgi:hypothetical protein